MAENVMWNGTCASKTFEEQLLTTRLAGCEVLSITPDTYRRRISSGNSAADLRQMADDQGVRLSHLDPLQSWVSRSTGGSASTSEGLDVSVEEFLDIADALGCESITAICTAPAGTITVDQFVDDFGRLCEKASGLRVDLEFIPAWALPDLETAWRIVEQVGASNGGILLDFWHFFRGAPSFDVLDTVPASRIHSVQACDALLVPLHGRTVLQDMLEDRRPLGRGEFLVSELLDTLARKQALTVVGPEYYSSQLKDLTPAEIASVVDSTYWTRLEPLGVKRST